jgi:hypothetical protein
MNLVKLIEFLRDRLKTVVWIACAVAGRWWSCWMPSRHVVDKEHAHTTAERWPGFWAVFGFVGCVVIILVSKVVWARRHYEGARITTNKRLQCAGYRSMTNLWLHP